MDEHDDVDRLWCPHCGRAHEGPVTAEHRRGTRTEDGRLALMCLSCLVTWLCRGG